MCICGSDSATFVELWGLDKELGFVDITRAVIGPRCYSRLQDHFTSFLFLLTPTRQPVLTFDSQLPIPANRPRKLDSHPDLSVIYAKMASRWYRFKTRSCFFSSDTLPTGLQVGGSKTVWTLHGKPATLAIHGLPGHEFMATDCTLSCNDVTCQSLVSTGSLPALHDVRVEWHSIRRDARGPSMISHTI